MLQQTSDKDQSSRSSNSHFFISSSILTKAFKSLKDKIAKTEDGIALPLFGRLVHSAQKAPTHQHLSTIGSTKTGSSRSSSAAYWSASSENAVEASCQSLSSSGFCCKKLRFWSCLSFWPSMFDSQRSQRTESQLWPHSQKVDRDFPVWNLFQVRDLVPDWSLGLSTSWCLDEILPIAHKKSLASLAEQICKQEQTS